MCDVECGDRGQNGHEAVSSDGVRCGGGSLGDETRASCRQIYDRFMDVMDPCSIDAFDLGTVGQPSLRSKFVQSYT